MVNPFALAANFAANATVAVVLHCTGAGLAALHVGVRRVPLVGPPAQAILAGVCGVSELLQSVGCPTCRTCCPASTPPRFLGRTWHECAISELGSAVTQACATGRCRTAAAARGAAVCRGFGVDRGGSCGRSIAAHRGRPLKLHCLLLEFQPNVVFMMPAAHTAWLVPQGEIVQTRERKDQHLLSGAGEDSEAAAQTEPADGGDALPHAQVSLWSCRDWQRSPIPDLCAITSIV